MPAAEVIRAVRGIQIPVEIDAEDFADRAAQQNLLDLHVLGRVAVVAEEERLDPEAARVP